MRTNLVYYQCRTGTGMIMIPGMVQNKSNKALSTVQQYRAKMAGHGTARRCAAELALRCAALLFWRSKLSSAGTWYDDTYVVQEKKNNEEIKEKLDCPQVMYGGSGQVGGLERSRMYQPSPLRKSTK